MHEPTDGDELLPGWAPKFMIGTVLQNPHNSPHEEKEQAH